MEDILSGELLACSNGFFDGKAGTGTFGWVLANKNRHIIFRNAGPVDSHPELMSSYRAELSRLLNVLYIVKRICTFQNIHTGTVTIYFDNKSAL